MNVSSPGNEHDAPTAACTCGQRHTTWTNDKGVSNEGHSVACPANPQFAKPSAAITRRSVIEEAQLAYAAHWEQMFLSYPELRMTPWDDQDAAVREAWIEAVTPEERSFA